MATKCKIIEIKLTPITPFFFGKENLSEIGNKFDYFQTSSENPQQTTLLGFLRHKILRDNGINLDSNNFRNDKSYKIDELIGNNGFIVNNNKPNYFGKIISYSYPQCSDSLILIYNKYIIIYYYMFLFFFCYFFSFLC